MQLDDPQAANLLLVDDRPENLVALEAILAPLGQNLVRAYSGVEALKHLLTRDFAVILMDVQMPGMDGFEAAALIKEREKSRHIPIIFVTAISKDERYVFQGYSAGAVDYIRKPFDPDILRSKVTVFVDLFKKGEQIKRQAELLRQAELREAERRREESEREMERRHMADLAEREAQLSQFKATLDATLDSVLLFDPKSLGYFYVNQGALNHLGYTYDEMLGMTPLEIMPEFDTECFRQMTAPLIEGAQAAHTFETSHCRKDGTKVPVEVFLQYVAQPGEAGRFVTIARDISERKRAEAALVEAYERDRYIAQTLQRSMLLVVPEETYPGLSVETLHEVAWQEAQVGGDFFDTFALSDGKVALVVGDASGKGLVAAARTTEVKYTLRAYLREHSDPARALSRLNNFVCEARRLDDKVAEGFIVLSVAVVDAQSGEVTYAAAGAEPLLLLQADGEARMVEESGMPLGIEPEAEYTDARLHLAEGDTVLIATDGITEARRNRREFLGFEGMTRLAQESLSSPSLRKMGQAILDGARAFTGSSLQDDACLLLARRQ